MNSGTCGSGNCRAASVPSAKPRLVGDLRLGAQRKVETSRNFVIFDGPRLRIFLPWRLPILIDENGSATKMAYLIGKHESAQRLEQAAGNGEWRPRSRAVAKFVAALGVATRAGDRLQAGKPLAGRWRASGFAKRFQRRVVLRNEPKSVGNGRRQELAQTLKCDERSQNR